MTLPELIDTVCRNGGQVKFTREGRGICKVCGSEREVVVPWIGRPGAGPQTIGMEALRWAAGRLVLSRHLNRIEEYTARGARPSGFCPGSLGDFDLPKLSEQPREKKRK